MILIIVLSTMARGITNAQKDRLIRVWPSQTPALPIETGPRDYRHAAAGSDIFHR